MTDFMRMVQFKLMGSMKRLQKVTLGLCAIAHFAFSPACMAAEPLSDSPLSVSGYAEAYYVHDFNDPDNHQRPFFTYSHNRANTPSINLAMVKASFNQPSFRANLALASGTYMRANYAAEPRGLQKVYEANAGLRLSENAEVWLDVGVMPSHLGFESAVGIENWTMTRSLSAESSPYYETGARLSYTTDDGKWYMSGLVLNGWQRITSVEGNTTPSFGHQLTYKPNDSVTLNSSSFVGNDKSDQDRRMRYFHNFYGQFKLDEAWSLIAALDVGAEQKFRNSSDYNVWFTPIVIARYRYTDALSFSARAEYYQDKEGVIIATDTPHGFRTTGYSVNMDYKLHPKVTLRTEVRKFVSKDAIFDEDGERLKKTNLMIGSAVAVSF